MRRPAGTLTPIVAHTEMWRQFALEIDIYGQKGWFLAERREPQLQRFPQKYGFFSFLTGKPKR